MDSFLLVVCIWVIGFGILYFLIKSAIDNSETAQNIRVIKEILSRQYPIDNIEEDEDPENKISEALSTGEATGRCPACNAEVPENASECPSCGLALK
jgi:hypothetical protein